MSSWRRRRDFINHVTMVKLFTEDVASFPEFHIRKMAPSLTSLCSGRSKLRITIERI